MLQNTQSNSVQGTVITNDLEKVLNLYTSSFTTSFNEGFLKLLEYHQNNMSILSSDTTHNDIKSESKSNGKKIRNGKNLGFDKLKNTTLRNELQICNSIQYDVNKHVRVKDLGFKTIYELDKRSNKMWKEYFSKNEVYLDRNINSSKLSQRILFDKSIKDYLTSKGSKSKKGSDSNPF
jgi:hypothetical protein